MKKISSKPVYIIYPYSQFEGDWINPGHRISHSDVSRIWAKTQPPPNDTPVFGGFLSRNTSKYSEICRVWTEGIIRIYYIVTSIKKCVIEFKKSVLKLCRIITVIHHQMIMAGIVWNKSAYILFVELGSPKIYFTCAQTFSCPRKYSFWRHKKYLTPKYLYWVCGNIVTAQIFLLTVPWILYLVS